MSAELWKIVLEFTSICELRIMDFVLTEDSLEMGERANFDEEISILKYRPVNRVFADSVLELITSISIPQDTADSRSGKLLKCLLSRPTALRIIDLTYPPDRIIQPSPLDSYVWDNVSACSNLRELTVDQYSHLSESNLRTLSAKSGEKVLSLTFCCDVADGVVNLLPDLLPNLKKLELQAKSADQIIHGTLLTVPDMSRFLNLQILTDAGNSSSSFAM